jgi:hypothetical protein
MPPMAADRAETRAEDERKKREAVEADRDMAVASHNRATIEVAALRRARRRCGAPLACGSASGRRGGGSEPGCKTSTVS